MQKVTTKHFILLMMIAVFSVAAFAQTTAFNFQGWLNDGSSAANGNYDLQFKLFDALTGGNQVNATVDRPNLMIINGVFSTTLDFGSLAFNTTGNRFLEISVRPAGSPNAHVVLGARQQILTVPFAARSASATNADNATNALIATTANNSLSLGSVSASNYARLNFANQGDVSAANLGAAGYISVQGNALQPNTSNGFPKIMLAVTADGTIARCYNGVTGASGGNCGVTIQAGTGNYGITFPFPIANRFWLVTDHSDANTNPSDIISARVTPTVGGNPNLLFVETQRNGTKENRPFHMFIF
jgi:hypothetical protein